MPNESNWTPEIEKILEKMRINSVILSNRHRKIFYEYKGFTKYFDIPVIIISVSGSSFSLGAVGFVKQEYISIISCFIGMTVTVLTSIKLYLNLDDRLKNELEMSKHFHSLALKLFKILNLPAEQRGSDGLYLLNSKYSDYIKLVEQSSLSRNCIVDNTLLDIPKNYIKDDKKTIKNNVGIIDYIICKYCKDEDTSNENKDEESGLNKGDKKGEDNGDKKGEDNGDDKKEEEILY